MSTLTGTGTLARFLLRRDRLRLSVWVLALAGSTIAALPTLDDTFDDQKERQARAALMDSPTGIVFGGPGYGLDDYTLGPMLVNEMTMSLLIAMAVMSILHVVRHTRAEEEDGRAELLRAGVVGSSAQTAAALLTLCLINLLIGGSIALAMVAFDLPVADSTVYGLGVALAGISFGALAAVCAQVLEHARSASGLAFLVTGVLFLFRAVGDIAEEGGNTLSWLSPFAWVQQTRPFDGLRWEPLALYVVFVLVLSSATHALARRRDVGAGVVAPRPGPAEAGRLLSGVLRLHLHQQRGAIIAWAVAVLAFGYAFGGLATEVEDMLDSAPDLAAFLGGDTDDLVDGFLGMIASYVIMAAAAYGVLSVSRVRAEENAGHAELLLSTAVGRVHWFGAALVVALVSTVVITLTGGLGLGLGASVALEDAEWTWRMVESVLARLPAVLVFGALAALSSGAAPRLPPLTWLWFCYSVVTTMFGALFELPEEAMNLSAFEILAKPPMDEFAMGPYLLYLGAVTLMVALSLVGFGNRDLVTT